MAQQPPVDQGLLHDHAQLDTPQSVWLL